MTYDNDLINTVLYEYYNTDIIITDLAKKYHVSPKSIYNWRKKVNENDYIGKDIKSARKNEICHERKEYKCKLTTEIRQYIDNCINKNKSQHKGWNHKGKKLYRKTYSKIRKGVSLLMAISKEKVIGYEISEKAFNGQTFTDFIKSIDNNNNTYLMDNARIHHSKIFKQYKGTQ